MADKIDTSMLFETLDAYLRLGIDRKVMKELSVHFGWEDYTEEPPVNLSIRGMPGIGKSSMVKQWGERQKNIQFVEVDGAHLRVSPSGYRIFSEGLLERLKAPNDTVLFIDNYNTIQPDVENELNRFLDDRVIVNVEDGNVFEDVFENVVLVITATTILAK